MKQAIIAFHNRLSHHPPVFALFLFYEKKTCTKRKVGRGTEPALSARTNRSRAPTTSSRAVLAPPSTPVGFARQPSCIPTYMYSRTARILNRALYCSVYPIIAVSLSESVCTRVRAKKSGAEYSTPLNSYFGKMCRETHFSGKQEVFERLFGTNACLLVWGAFFKKRPAINHKKPASAIAGAGFSYV